MKMKQWLSVLILLCCMIGVSAAALASDITGINVMSTRQIEGEPMMYVELRGMNGAGVGVSMRQEDYFTFTSMGAELKAQAVPAGSLGHIVVVDTSRYYYEKEEYITSFNIQDIVSVYLNGLKYNERIRFILSTNSGITDTGYMPLEDAKGYVSQIKLNNIGNSSICTAITTAFEGAMNPSEDAPPFNSVFIVADPDLASNSEQNYSLESAAQMVIASKNNFDVFVAMPRRESFLKITNQDRRNALENGFSAFQNFASKVEGRFVTLPQSESSVDTTPLYELLIKNFYTSNQYIVDYSALEEFLPRDPKIQTVEFVVTGKDGASKKFDYDVPVDLLPLIIRTPVPEGPTPTPKPTPVVHIGQKDAVAVKAIRALRNMNYLSSVNYDSFNNECFSAYVDFCERNDMNARDGIYENEFNFLVSEQGVAVPIVTPEPTPTPTPSPTPEPTIPPAGYNINDSDTQTSGGFIAQMQAILKDLNCYDKNAQANAGRLDQATLDAINRYCKAYGWINNRADGVNREIVESIIVNGPNLVPVTDPTPTPQPTATPAPTATPEPTIPPKGYSLNDTDTAESGGFIAKMQAVLKSLNCYALNTEANAGRLDQATLDAVNTYCKSYGWSNKRADGVDKEIVESILNNGEKLEPLPPPKASVKDQVREFLMSELTIMQYKVPMYIPVIACAVLIFIIVAIILLTRKGGKKAAKKAAETNWDDEPQKEDENRFASAQTPVAPISVAGAGEEVEGGTIAPFSTKYVTMNISYEGQSWQIEAKLTEQPFIIARHEEGVMVDLELSAADKSVSRKCHAELVYQNGQVYLRDKSKFGNTELNGTRVCEISRDGLGVSIHSGAMIKISEHRIVITW